MALLIDQPRWAAHGTRFAHLISDTSLSQLWRFARDQGLPDRAFDHDHFDVREDHHAAMVAAGAQVVDSAHLARRLRSAGLRVDRADRLPSRARAVAQLRVAWQELMPTNPELGERLISRWSEPHRHYHDTRHLVQMLTALALLSDEVPVAVRLAAWFHDAVYRGEPGTDEAASAALAEQELSMARFPSAQLPSTRPTNAYPTNATVAEVVRLILLTIDHQPEPRDESGVLLVDADLSILGQQPGRYLMYLNGVRAEHENLSEQSFKMARMGVVGALLSQQGLYRSQRAQHLWLDQARENLLSEETHWRG